MKAEKLLVIVLVMQALTLAGQWAGPTGSAVARADIPNPGERQLALLEEAKQTNAKLDKLISLLQSGDLQVRVAKTDDEKK
ncbi:MAG TPA: hypothetical protein VFE47_29070 [Tepidisphaeraceae bacterium]|jgi:hypothetical protein|nr:hypothetical protein [Tepidisphaeraceae bacterium]